MVTLDNLRIWLDEGDVKSLKNVKPTSLGVTRILEFPFGDDTDAMSDRSSTENAMSFTAPRPTELCLVTPSCKRSWDTSDFRPTVAGSAYTGPFSRKCQTYAERFYPGAWCILDPRNGFLFPDEVIRWGHGACLFRPWTEPIGLQELRSQVRRRKLDGYDRIVVMGGRRFIFLVEDVFPGRKVRAPLAGVGGIGDMMHELNTALSSGNRL